MLHKFNHTNLHAKTMTYTLNENKHTNMSK